MLSTLHAGGHFDRVSAIVLGDFHQCDPGLDGITVDEVLRDRLGRLGKPVIAGAPIGHGPRNEPVILGGRARVTAQGDTAILVTGG
jgi:muramoyltetrapeptide carboxypeptidase